MTRGRVGAGVEASASKSALRTELEARRRAVPPARRAFEEELVQAAVQATPEWKAARTVLVYRAFGAELSVVGLTLAAWRGGKRVAFPRLDGPRLALREVASWSALHRSRLGVDEPAASATPVAAGDVDLAIVPGLGFTTGGDRLGRGGGHYDRLLPDLPRAWGVAFDCQIVPVLPKEAHDHRVHRIFAASLIQATADGQT